MSVSVCERECVSVCVSECVNVCVCVCECEYDKKQVTACRHKELVC